jgi:hypothetical protein
MEMKPSSGKMNKKKRIEAEKLEDGKSTDASVRKQLANVKKRISEFADYVLYKEEWASITDEIQQAINSAKTPDDIDKTAKEVRSATFFLLSKRHPDLPEETSPSKGSLGHSLVEKVQTFKLKQRSLLRTGYKSDPTVDPLHLLDAQACYLGSTKLLEMKKIPEANRLAREAIEYSTVFKPFSQGDAGKKGGLSKASNQQPFRDLVAVLQVELSPPAGWKSLYAASVVIGERILDPKFNEYLKIYHDSGFYSAYPHTAIYAWFLRDAKRAEKDRELKIRLAKK